MHVVGKPYLSTHQESTLCVVFPKKTTIQRLHVLTMYPYIYFALGLSHLSLMRHAHLYSLDFCAIFGASIAQVQLKSYAYL